MLCAAVAAACSSTGNASVGQTTAGNHLDFTLTNFTGTSLRSVYLSPSTSKGWEENILAGTELKDGDNVKIRFDPNEKSIEWDLRIEGVDGHFAEWKNLKLGDLTKITLALKPSPQPTAIAEID